MLQWLNTAPAAFDFVFPWLSRQHVPVRVAYPFLAIQASTNARLHVYQRAMGLSGSLSAGVVLPRTSGTPAAWTPADGTRPT